MSACGELALLSATEAYFPVFFAPISLRKDSDQNQKCERLGLALKDLYQGGEKKESFRGFQIQHVIEVRWPCVFYFPKASRVENRAYSSQGGHRQGVLI